MIDAIDDLYAARVAASDAVDTARAQVASARWARSAIATGGAGIFRELSSARWGQAPVMIGASILQTPGGVVSEMDRINDDVMIFSKEITDEVERRGYPDPSHDQDPIVVLFRSTWTPFVQAWQAFYGKNATWTRNLWWNHAPEAEQFLRQLDEIRSRATTAGMTVNAPAPFVPKVGFVEGALGGIGAAIGSVWGLVRALVYVGLVAGGAFVLLALVRQWRSLPR